MELIHTELIINESTFCPRTIAFVVDKGELVCYRLDINQYMLDDLKTNLGIEVNLIDYINEWTKKYSFEEAAQIILKDKERFGQETQTTYERIMNILNDKRILENNGI
jgi:hypothetical protein